MNKFNFKSVYWRTKAFVWTLSFLCIVSIFTYWSLVVGFQFINKKEISQRDIKPNPFATVKIEAKSAFVWDVINKRPLYEKNALDARPLASLTKVMTAVTIANIAPNLKDVTIKLADLSPEGDSKLRVASTWSVKNLIDYVLLVSSNDGAHALAASAGVSVGAIGNGPKDIDAINQDVDVSIGREIFIRKMNELSGKIGLTNSTFLNEHGLDSLPTQEGGQSSSGAYGSARDMAILFEYAMRNYPHILEATRYQDLKISDLQSHNYMAENTNEIINSIPSPIASKTGYTQLAGGNLVVAFDAGLDRPIIISVLGSSAEGRFTDVLKLVDSTMKYLQSE